MSPLQCHFLSPSQVGICGECSTPKGRPHAWLAPHCTEASAASSTWLIPRAPPQDNSHTAIGFRGQEDTAGRHGEGGICAVFGFGQKHSLRMIVGRWDTLSSNGQSEALVPKSLPNSLSQTRLCSLDHPQGLRGRGQGGKAASWDP